MGLAGSDGKESVGSTGDLGSIPGSGTSPGEGNGNPPQYSCPENPWWATIHGVAKSQTQLSDFILNSELRIGLVFLERSVGKANYSVTLTKCLPIMSTLNNDVTKNHFKQIISKICLQPTNKRLNNVGLNEDYI